MIGASNQSSGLKKLGLIKRKSLNVAGSIEAEGGLKSGLHLEGLDAATLSVKRMYEQHPYPSPVAGDSLISDLANAVGFLFRGDDLAGWRILDAGCGTGHRLVGLAARYPKAQFTGIDMTASSLSVARRIAQKHEVANVEFLQGNLLQLDLSSRYDLIVSTGVIHHLTDPEAGLRNLCGLMAQDGILMVWLYHSLGEFQRLLNREMALLILAEERANIKEGLDILRELNLSLSVGQYGTRTAKLSTHETNQASLDVDAYLHPIVNAYRFQQAFDMLSQCQVEWAAINSINLEGQSKLIDLRQVSSDPFFCVTAEDLFESSALRDKYCALSDADKLKLIELVLKPTGFTILAGKDAGLNKCGDRIRHSAIKVRPVPCVNQ